MADNEHQFESDIEALMTGELGWRREQPEAAASGTGQTAPGTEQSKTYQRELALDLSTLVGFVKASQSKAWAFFAKA